NLNLTPNPVLNLPSAALSPSDRDGAGMGVEPAESAGVGLGPGLGAMASKDEPATGNGDPTGAVAAPNSQLSTLDSQLALDALPDHQLSTINHQLSFGSRWSLHEVSIYKAVAEGIVERINKKTGRHESRDDFLKRLEAECIDKEQWQQE